LRSLVTVAALAAFLAIAWWAYAPSHRERFERDALLPFGDDEDEGVDS
jgi:cytochrome c oxidase cbb3-type subunit 4